MPETKIFLAYPSLPALVREAMNGAADRIGSIGGVRARRWEDLHVGGRIVIAEVLREIDACDAGIYEVTSLNQNVVFELGFAVGRRKHVFPMLQGSITDAKKSWASTRILESLGYREYENSDDIRAAFLTERPDLRETALFDESIAPALRPAGSPSIFYVTSLYGDNASGALTRVIREETSRGVRLALADPRETAVQPVTWYAQQIYDAAAVVIHFESPSKIGADVHNARAAFVGGLTHGMGKPLLMLAAEDYGAPFDYKDLLYIYTTAAECSTRATYWLTRELEPTRHHLASIAADHARREIATELRTLRLGAPVAENEAADLDQYFVPTAVYSEVMADRTAVYVGRRGSGKTATMLEAARRLSEDRRNLVCSITPSGYQMDALARLLRTYRERDTRGYAIEAIWKFLLYTEMALAAVRDIRSRPAGLQPDAPEFELSVFLDGPGSDLKADFDVRLERAIRNLEAAQPADNLEAERRNITEALHREALHELRPLLERALASRNRVAILIDNLDRAWDQKSDLEPLAYLLLGLLSSVPAIIEDLRRGGGGHPSLPLTGAVFIRSDIYGQIVATALEPDKLPVRRLAWEDPALLIDVINERYAASVGREIKRDELWDRFFCKEVRRLDVRDYILGRVLPRPRDVLVFVQAAIEAALVRSSPVVDVEHVLAADVVYSQFAFDAIKIEDPVFGSDLEDACIEFAGGSATLTAPELAAVLDRAGFTASQHADAIGQLRNVSFIGIETGPDRFDFAEDPQAMRRADVIAARLADGPRYRIHSAFRPYLDIADPEEPSAFRPFLDIPDPEEPNGVP
jgi:hypothetical protein